MHLGDENDDDTSDDGAPASRSIGFTGKLPCYQCAGLFTLSDCQAECTRQPACQGSGEQGKMSVQGFARDEEPG